MYEFFRRIVALYVRLKFRKHIINSTGTSLDLRKGGYILAANHQNYYDPVVLAGIFRGHFSFMAKSELFEKNKLFAALIRFCGAFPVVRGAGDNKAIDMALDDIKKGRVFVIFPEGSRSKDGKIGRGRSGVALIAAKTGVPIIPVCIMYKMNGEKKRLDVAIGSPIELPEIAELESGGYGDVKKASALIIDSIKSLQQEIFSNTDNSEKDGNNNEC